MLLRRRLGDPAYIEPARDLLFAGVLAALAVGVPVAWWRSRPLGNVWQEGVVAVLAGFGSLLVGFLAALGHRLLGLPGIALWTLVALAVGIAGTRWARRGGQGDSP